jgi:hypothetical protein
VIPIIPIIQTVDPKFLLVVGVSYNFKISQFRQRDPNRFNTKIDKIDIQIDSKYIQNIYPNRFNSKMDRNLQIDRENR